MRLGGRISGVSGGSKGIAGQGTGLGKGRKVG